MAFEHLKESADECFTDAARLRAEKPEASVHAMSSGYSVLASYYLANNDNRSSEAIRALLSNELERYKLFSNSVYTFFQHQNLILALAIGDINVAKTIGSLPIDRKNWGAFDAYTTYRICSLLKMYQDSKAPRFSPTKPDAAFVKALNDIESRRAFDPSDIDSFWKSLRKKRYQFTIFEHQNLFEPALRTLQENV